jgi:hypothetical protein
MSYQTLEIEFRGICTHFRNTVPGVPHRVVLPSTATWHPGLLTTPQSNGTQLYWLPPHFGHVSSPGYEAITVPGIDSGLIVGSVRLEIANAVDDDLTYPDPPPEPSENLPYDGNVRSIADFATNYRYSGDVVLGGRARCYFDVFRGQVFARRNGNAIHGVVRVTTDGVPRLQVTPMVRRSEDGPAFKDVKVHGGSLVVRNSGFSCNEAPFDFLWHLLTSDKSIQEHLPQLPLGFLEELDCELKSVIEQFTELEERGFPGALKYKVEEFIETSASCSNSGYP